MKKPWSISTTVRNPERILPFLETLSEMQGEKFDEKGQIKFQTLLIKNKLYKPTGLSSELLSYYSSDNSVMIYAQAAQIFQHMLDSSAELRNDPGLRGRTSAAPLTKMGLAIARRSKGPVVITKLGKAYINDEIDVGEVYFRFFLKWQIPTPGSNDFSNSDIYDIKPFIGTLQLIGRVNQLAHQEGMVTKGLSREEFSVFAPTLVKSNDIEKYAQEIVRIRRVMENKTLAEARNIFKVQINKFVSSFIDTNDDEKIIGLLNNLYDYGDNTIRYFRLTRYVYIRGGGYYIDLEPRRKTEINELLKMSARSEEFENSEAYTLYMADADKPELPWETKDKLQQIYTNIVDDIQRYTKALNIAKPKEDINQYSASVDLFKDKIREARGVRRDLQEQLNHQEAASIESLNEYIDKLTNIFKLENKSVQLEKYTNLGLHALNDAIKIKPNYPVGDDNEPTFTAPANVPDIECFYDNANSICEVTMLTSRDQYYNEGQPVMRHLRDFEDKNGSKATYCVFIAPAIHRDTVNTYWTAVKYEYEGIRQKIVPLTIGNFTEILRTLSMLKNQNKIFKHTDLIKLYDMIIALSDQVANSSVWLETIPSVISKWQKKLTEISQ
jgi:hypothetical protein